MSDCMSDAEAIKRYGDRIAWEHTLERRKNGTMGRIEELLSSDFEPVEWKKMLDWVKEHRCCTAIINFRSGNPIYIQEIKYCDGTTLKRCNK